MSQEREAKHTAFSEALQAEIQEDESSIKQFGRKASLDSLESFVSDADDFKKKMLQGFDEDKQFKDLVCKPSKDIKLDEDDYENISDISAYTNMFPAHKASKFGGKINRQKSSKMAVIKNGIYEESEYQNEDIDLTDGRLAQLSFL